MVWLIQGDPAQLQREKLIYSKKAGTKKTATIETKTIPIRFKRKPALAICGTFINPEPKTIAFGGVATGNIKAQLAAIATAAVTNKGSKLD